MLSLQVVFAVTSFAITYVNTTVYRVTPRNYTDTLVNMDTGDINGDCIFAIFELTFPFWCKDNPNELNCKNYPILNRPGHNVYQEHEAQFDPRFGYYNLCNPNPDTGVFECVPGVSDCWYKKPDIKKNFENYCSLDECHCDAVEKLAVGREECAVCKSFMYPYYAKYFPECKKYVYLKNELVTTKSPLAVLPNATDGECCTAMGKYSAKYASKDINGTCMVFNTPSSVSLQNGTFSFVLTYGGFNGSAPDYASRVNLLANRVNGTWYSTQAGGWWKSVSVRRTVSADCVSTNIVRGVHSLAPECWNACPTPLNFTSACSIKCLLNTTLNDKFPSDAICSGFASSFKYKDPDMMGCPEVPLS